MSDSELANHVGDVVDDDHDDDDCVALGTGITDEERRDLRKCQRALRQRIVAQGRGTTHRPDNNEINHHHDALVEARVHNNELFRKVRYTREAVLDIDNVHLIVSQAVRNVDRPNQVQRYDVDRLMKGIKTKYRLSAGEMSFFHWKKFGADASVCFSRSVPTGTSFLHGWLDDSTEEENDNVGKKSRNHRPTKKSSRQPRREPATRDDDFEVWEVERPEELITGHNTNQDVDQLSAVERNLQDVHAALCERVKENVKVQKRNLEQLYGSVDGIPEDINKARKKHPDVCAVNLLVNPKSFTQTVENFYHYSFLVKKGVATLKVRHDRDMDGLHLPGGPVVRNVSSRSEKHPEPRQAAINLSMEDWRDLIEAYQVEQCEVPHRTGSKHEKSTPPSADGSPPPLLDDEEDPIGDGGDRDLNGRAGHEAELSPLQSRLLFSSFEEV